MRFVILFVLIPQLLLAQKHFTLNSPDGNIVFAFYNDNGNAAYSLSYKKNIVINKSYLSLTFKNGSYTDGLLAGKPVYKDSIEDYNLMTGKTSHVHDVYKEMLIPLKSKDQSNINIQLAVKAFNDGIAFQYRFSSTNNK